LNKADQERRVPARTAKQNGTTREEEIVAAGPATGTQTGTAREQGIHNRWETSVYGMNPEIVGAGIVNLGPGMAEGGEYKKLRDAFTMHIAVQHNVASSIEDIEANYSRELYGRRMRLTMCQLQFVELVSVVPSFHVMYSCSCDTTRLRIFPVRAQVRT
jgi:hypothetical protein